jgi:TPR repeat protein
MGRTALLVALAIGGAASMAQERAAAQIGADLEQTLAPARQAWLQQADEACEAGHWLDAASALERAAALDSVDAQVRLALMHWIGEPLYGRGPWSRAEADRLFRRAAGQGNAVARFMLEHNKFARKSEP